MPSTYGENTTYGTPNVPTPIFNSANLKKMADEAYARAMAKYQSAPATSAQQPTSGTSAPSFSFSDTRLSPSKAFPGLASTFSPVIGQPISPSPEWSSLPVSEYNLQNPASPLVSSPIQPLDLSQAPFTPTTKIVNLPKGIGEGQYLTDPSQPGKYEKNEYPFSADEKKMILGNLPANRYQIEHIVPRWAGGANTLENIQVLDTASHEKKTNVQAVPYTLYYYSNLMKTDPNKMTPDQVKEYNSLSSDEKAYFSDPNNQTTIQKARLMAIDWKNHSSSDVPVANGQTGLHKVSDAIALAKQWQEAPKVGLKEWASELLPAINKIGSYVEKRGREVASGIPVLGPAALGAMKGLTSEVALGYPRKIAPDAYKENAFTDVLNVKQQLQVKFKLNDLTNARDEASARGDLASVEQYNKQIELVKDIWNNPGLFKKTAEDQEMEKINQTAERAGEMIGGLIGGGMAFAGLGKVAGETGKILKGGKSVSEIPLVGRIFKPLLKTPQTAAEVAEMGENAKAIGSVVPDSVAKTLGPVTEEAVKPLVSTFIKDGKILLDMTSAGQAVRAQVLKNTANMVGLNVAMGLLHQKDDRSLDATLEQGAFDIMYGLALGGQRHDLSGYLKTVLAGTTLGLMQTRDLEQGLTNGLMMGVMHATSHKAAAPEEKIAKSLGVKIESPISRAAKDLGSKTYNKLLGRTDPLVEKASDWAAERELAKYGVVPKPTDDFKAYEPSKEYLKISDPKNVAERQAAVAKVKDTVNELFNNSKAIGPDGKEYEAKWSLEDRDAAFMTANTALRQAEYKGMGEVQRTKAQLADLRSLVREASERNRILVESSPKSVEDAINTNPEAFAHLSAPKANPQPNAEVPADAPIGKTAITGTFTAERRDNWAEFLSKGANEREEKLLLIADPERRKTIESAEAGKNAKDIADGVAAQDKNPQHLIKVYGVVKNPDGTRKLLDLGVLPTDHRLNSKKIRTPQGLMDAAYNTREGGALNIDKDQIGDYMQSHGIRSMYVNMDGPVTFEKGGKPYAKLDFAVENIEPSLKDFAGTYPAAPNTTIHSDVVMAIQADTAAKADEVAQTILKKAYVEPADILMDKATPSEAKTLQGKAVNDSLAQAKEAFMAAKDPISLKQEIKDRFGFELPDAVAQNWFKNPETATTRAFFEQVYEAAKAGDPVATILYTQNIYPYLRSPEFFSMPAGKTVLEMPLVGNMPKGPEAYPGETKLTPAEESRMESVLGRPKEAAVYTEDQETPWVRTKTTRPEEVIGTQEKAVPQAVEPQAIKEAKVPEKGFEVEQLPPKEATFGGKAMKKISKPVATPAEGKIPNVSTEGELATQDRLEKTPISDMPDSVTKPSDFGQIGKGGLLAYTKEINARKAMYAKGSPEWKKLDQGVKEIDKTRWLNKMKEIVDKKDPEGKFLYKDEKGNIDVNKAFVEFKDSVSSLFNHFGFKDPAADPKNTKALFRLFNRAVESGDPVQRLVPVQKGKEITYEVQTSNPEPLSKIERRMASEFGKKPDFLFYKESEADKFRTGEPEKMVLEINQAFRDKGYIPIASTGNKASTIFGVKMDKDIASRYDANPAKYESKTFPESNPKTTEDKFIRVLMVDGFGYSPDEPKSSLKYLRNLTPHETPNAARDENGNERVYKAKLVPSKTLGELDVIDKSFLDGSKPSMGFHEDKGAAAMKALLERAAMDGNVIVTKRTLEDMQSQNGMGNKAGVLKFGGIPTYTKDGLILQKGQFVALSPYEAKRFKEATGIDINDFDLITFKDNIKVGKKVAENYSEFDVPGSDMSLMYQNDHEAGSSFSPQILSKYATDVDLSNLKKRYAEKSKVWEDFNKDIENAKDGKTILSVFDKYKKDLGTTIEGFSEYQPILDSIKQGAGRRSLDEPLKRMSLAILQKQVLNGGFIKGDYLKLRPDMGFYDVYNPTTKKYEQRHLKTNEIAVPTDKLKELGMSTDPKKEQYLLVERSPITRETAMIKAKVVPVDPKLHAMGNDSVSLSHHDVFVRMEGDYDGDAVTLFKIGGKDGIPESMGDRINADREKTGDFLLSALNKHSNTGINANSLKDFTVSSIMGGTEIGRVSSAVRVMNDLAGAKISAQVINGNLVVFSNGKPIDSIPVKGKGKLKGEPMKLDWGEENQFLASTMSQESSDSVKSPDLEKRINKSGMKDTAQILLSKVFGTEDKDVLQALKKFVDRMQTPYLLADKNTPIESTESLKNQLLGYSDLVSKIRKSGGEVGHLGQIAEGFKDMKTFDGLDPYLAVKADTNAVTRLKNLVKGTLTEKDLNSLGMTQEEAEKVPFYGKQKEMVPMVKDAEALAKALVGKKIVKEPSPLVSAIMDVNESRFNSFIDSEKYKRGNPELGDLDSKRTGEWRQGVLDRINENYLPKMSDAEREAFNYWLLTSDGANFKFGVVNDDEYRRAAKILGYEPNEYSWDRAQGKMVFLPQKEGKTYLYNPLDRRQGLGRSGNQGVSDSWRFLQVVNDTSPDMAKAYYKSVENFEQTPESKSVDTRRVLDQLDKNMKKAEKDLSSPIADGNSAMIKKLRQFSLLKPRIEELRKDPQPDLDKVKEALRMFESLKLK